MTPDVGDEPNAAALLRRMVEQKASDLHLEADSPPVLRIDGELEPQELPPLNVAAMAAILEEITDDEQRERFDEEKELDFAYTAAGIGRFRVNAALQRGTITLAFRLVREQIPSLEELGLPDICGSLALKRRAGADHRPDGLWQINHPGRHDRLPQREGATPPCHH